MFQFKRHDVITNQFLSHILQNRSSDWFNMNKINKYYISKKNRWDYSRNIRIVNGNTKDFFQRNILSTSYSLCPGFMTVLQHEYRYGRAAGLICASYTWGIAMGHRCSEGSITISQVCLSSNVLPHDLMLFLPIDYKSAEQKIGHKSPFC